MLKTLKTVIFRQQPFESQKVIILSGGGSGHEPAHTGYLGDGMLDVCVVGNIFASPSSKQIVSGLNAVSAPRGYHFSFFLQYYT